MPKSKPCIVFVRQSDCVPNSSPDELYAMCTEINGSYKYLRITFERGEIFKSHVQALDAIKLTVKYQNETVVRPFWDGFRSVPRYTKADQTPWRIKDYIIRNVVMTNLGWFIDES